MLEDEYALMYSRELTALGVKSWIFSLDPESTYLNPITLHDTKRLGDREAISKLFVTLLILRIPYV